MFGVRAFAHVLAIYCVTQSSHLAASNRILEILKDTAASGHRCMKKPVSQPACAVSQQRAKNTNKINLEEYATLVKENLYPTFDSDGDLAGVCSCGCFSRGTRLAVTDTSGIETEWKPIDTLTATSPRFSIWTLAGDSTISEMRFSLGGLKRTTKGQETSPLIFVTTKNNLHIGLTQEHAVLLASGEMVPAEALKVGDLLVNQHGGAERIDKIEHRAISDDVFNILTDGDSRLSHLILAEGLVVGDLAWQNSLALELYAVAVRQ
jgi:hypothetical protein